MISIEFFAWTSKSSLLGHFLFSFQPLNSRFLSLLWKTPVNDEAITHTTLSIHNTFITFFNYFFTVPCSFRQRRSTRHCLFSYFTTTSGGRPSRKWSSTQAPNLRRWPCAGRCPLPRPRRARPRQRQAQTPTKWRSTHCRKCRGRLVVSRMRQKEMGSNARRQEKIMRSCEEERVDNKLTPKITTSSDWWVLKKTRTALPVIVTLLA